MALNFTDPTSFVKNPGLLAATAAEVSQNLYNSNGEYRADVDEYNTRQAAQELYDEAQRMKEEQEMQSKSTEKKTNWKLILGIGAAVAVVIVVVILLKKKK